jgi:hypothetical protein
MPLIAYECACGHRYEDLTGSTISDTGSGACPKCGRPGNAVPSRFGFTGLLNEHLMDPVERQMLENNRAMLEQMHVSGDVDDGSFKIAEKGPAQFRPFGNDSFDRKKAMEEVRVIPNANQA